MSRAKDTLFLIRAKEFDRPARLLAERLAQIGGVRVIAVVDERGGLANTAPFDKISLHEDALAGIGFTGLPENWGWFYGDMCYYLAASHFPDYPYYALIESDVYLPESSVKPLLTAFEASDADAIAAQLAPTAEPKKFSKGLAALDLDPAWGCIFPLSRVSTRLLTAMQDLRRDALHKIPGQKLNDEGILVGAVQRGGYSVARLEDLLPALVSKDTFDTNPPHLFEAIAQDEHEARLFHPVVMFETVLARIGSGEKNYTRQRLRKVLRMAQPPMEQALIQALAKRETST